MTSARFRRERGSRRSHRRMHDGTPRLAHGPRKRVQVIWRRAVVFELLLNVNDIPAARSREALGMVRAQVVTVRLRFERQLTHNDGRISVHVRERRHCGARTRRLSALPARDHTGDGTRDQVRATRTTPRRGPGSWR